MSALAALAQGVGVLGSALWIRAALRSLGGRRRIPVLEAPPAPGALPPVTVVLAARDEGPALRATVGDLLAQTSLQLEVVVVDDRSSPPVARFDDPRVTLVRVDALPEGWLGKVHALERGLEAAPGRFPLVLLTDADVRFAPDALHAAVGHLCAEGLDHLCLLPRYDDRGLVLQAAIAASEGLLLSGRRAHLVGRAGRRAYLGLGAFGLIRRSALERAGGLAPHRLAVLDDMALARALHDSGAKAGLRRAGDRVHLEWYGRLSRLVRGLDKTLLAAARFRPARAALFGVGLLALGAGPPLTAWAGTGLPRGLALGATLALAASAVVQRLRDGRPLAPRLLLPAGLVVLGWAGLRAAWVGARRGALEWRGTRYPLGQLREALRARR